MVNIRTLCIHGNEDKRDLTGSVSVPIYQSATFAHPSVGETTGYDYSRRQNPTREHLEKTVAALESGTDAIAFSSGMAAISGLMEIFTPGDHIIASSDLYGGSIRLFQQVNTKNGLRFNFADTTSLDQIEALICKETKAIFIETPTNPTMRVTDISALSRIARSRNILLIVDNTFLTPYFQQPLLLGADIVMHSGTKYLCGHNDTLAGFLVVSDADLAAKLRHILMSLGSGLSPFDSWLLIRGIKTLSIRMEKQQENAMAIAQWLQGHEKVKKVYYVGLPDHPGFEISKRQSKGFGSMISFSVDSEETAKRILEKVNLILYAESLGGVETLITYPMLQTHADLSQEERDAKEINETMLRLSVGLEYADDLIEDLEQAFE
ncbi:trans-sulfuration enzyme family protein [Sinanaerobacter chloroacetimidivorans]|jgi:cystathionine gamma-synthase|uniref:PLP-dependent transferase n=1 Tax=Sinanaerobacter chloroacetimidivorans TaxID=2818044 RepID=A0A8J7VX45_9FIRM|nr:PLP-dependent transferase [Sinanaerobacter chloroacetimidivorans]